MSLERGTNLLSAANFLVSRCTSLIEQGECISVMDLNLFRVGIYPPLVNDKAEEPPRADPEDALHGIQMHVEPSERV